MIPFGADENFNNDIIRGVLSRNSDFDFVRVQDTEFAGAGDPAVLEWAARERRVLLTHDVSTMIDFAYQRITRGQGMSGLIVVPHSANLATVIEDLLVIAECGEPEDWENGVHFLPLG